MDDGRSDADWRNHCNLRGSCSNNVRVYAENRGKTGQDNVTELLKVVSKMLYVVYNYS